MGDALAGVIRDVDAEVVAVSYNDESWVTIDELQAMVGERGGAVCTLAFDSRRYVGAQIGIHNPQGEKVGNVSHLRNVEYVVVGGEPHAIRTVAETFGGYVARPTLESAVTGDRRSRRFGAPRSRSGRAGWS